jgi:hypothetical protein
VFDRAASRVRDALGEDLDEVLDALDRLVEGLRDALAENTSS